MANQTVRKKSFWEQYKLPILLLGGIAVGSIIGVVSPSLGQTLKPLGEIFLNLLFTIVVPLVFVSIASAVGSMLNMKRLGKILGSTILVFLVTGAIAGVCVLCWVNLFSPSAGTNIQMGQAEQERKAASDALTSAQEARSRLQAQIAAQAAAEEAERKAAIEEAKKAQESVGKDQSSNSSDSDGSSDSGSSSNSSDGGSSEEPPSFSTGSGNQAEVEVPDNVDPGPVETPSEKDAYVAEWGARIDAYLAGSPLAGQGKTFAEAAWTYGADPRFSPAIAMVESGLGAVCFRPHNAWGWGNASWSSWEEAIWDHVAGLASIYGGQLTYEGAQMYCPPNADKWYSSVLANMERI